MDYRNELINAIRGAAFGNDLEARYWQLPDNPSRSAGMQFLYGGAKSVADFNQDEFRRSIRNQRLDDLEAAFPGRVWKVHNTW